MSDVFKWIFATIRLCALITSPTLMAQETPPAVNASDTNVARPTLDELMSMFAKIETSYLPFHVDYAEFQNRKIGSFSEETNTGKTGPNPFEYRTQRGHQDSKVWMLESTVENQGASRTVRHVHSKSGLHRKETSPLPLFDSDDDDTMEPSIRPLEGVFPLMFDTTSPILLSQYFASAPTEFTLEWFVTLAKVVCHYRPAKDQYVTVELWLDPDFAWHPIFMRRYDMHTGNRLPDEWKVTEFRVLKELVRVSAGEFMGPIRRMHVPKDQPIAFFICRFQIEKSAYQDRVPGAVFSPETPIGGSPILELEPIGGAQVAVTSFEQAERTMAVFMTKEIREDAGEAMEEPAATEIPVAVAAIADDEIFDRLVPLYIELAELRTKFGISHPKVISVERRLASTKDLLNKFRGPEMPQSATEQLKIFNLKNSNANDIQLTIAHLFDGTTVGISVDNRTNALIIRANESQLREIEAILLKLDSTETAAKNSGTSNQPSIDANEPVTSIAEYRRQLDALEQPVLLLAEQVRAAETKQGKDHPDSAKLRADLRAAVQQTFAARQEIQRAELAEFTRRLQRMQQLVDTRDRIAEQIVERRIEELLDTRPERGTAVKESGKSRMLNAQDAADEPSTSTQRFKRTSVTANVTRADSSSRFFDDQPVLYGFPLDKTNRAILVLRAKLSEDDLKSIAVDLGDFVFPAKVIASNRTAKLLLVQVSADISFDSVPLAMEHIQTYQRVQIGGHSSFVEELVVADVKPDQNTGIGQQIVTDAAFGISDTSLILNHDGTQLLGLGIGDNTIIPAPEISKWLNATMSKIGVQPTSD